jgi:hypothetical protein
MRTSSVASRFKLEAALTHNVHFSTLRVDQNIVNQGAVADAGCASWPTICWRALRLAAGVIKTAAFRDSRGLGG